MLYGPTAVAQGSCLNASGYVATLPTEICAGNSVRVGANYIVSGNPTFTSLWQSSTNGTTWTTITNATTTSFTANPLVTTSYRYYMVCSAGSRYLGQATVTVTGATTGPALGLCSGSTGQLGAPGVTGATYAWTPTTGLSNPNIANPTITLTNTGTTAVMRTYTLTATSAQGCSDVKSVQVTVYPPADATATANGPTTFCAGGSVQLTATATGRSSFRWNTGATSATLRVTNSGTYSVTATNAYGCTATSAPIVVTVLAPTAIAGPARQLCGSASAQLGAAPEAGTTYSWSPSAGLSNANIANPVVSVSNPGTAPQTTRYVVTATSAQGCTSTDTVAVTANPIPLAPSITQATQPNGTVLLTSNAATGNQWYRNGSAIAGATNSTHLVTSSALNGAYTAVVTSAAGCASPASASQSVAVLLGIAARATAPLVQLYPNPATGQCRVEVAAAGWAQVEVFNTLGQMVRAQPVAAATTLNLQGLARGVYTVRVQLGAETVVKRLLLE